MCWAQTPSASAKVPFSTLNEMSPKKTVLNIQILFIFADDLGYGDLGSYGATVGTKYR